MGRLSPADFHTVYGFRRPRREAIRGLIPGLRSGLSLHRSPENPKLRCCPFSLYTFPAGVFGLGSGLPFEVSPNLSSSASLVSHASTQVFLKSAVYAIPPRPRAANELPSYNRAGLLGRHVSFLVSRVGWHGRSSGYVRQATSFDFLFGRITLIATASSDVLMCDA
jgi:hypothetical protein